MVVVLAASYPGLEKTLLAALVPNPELELVTLPSLAESFVTRGLDHRSNPAVGSGEQMAVVASEALRFPSQRDHLAVYWTS